MVGNEIENAFHPAHGGDGHELLRQPFDLFQGPGRNDSIPRGFVGGFNQNPFIFHGFQPSGLKFQQIVVEAHFEESGKGQKGYEQQNTQHQFRTFKKPLQQGHGHDPGH